MYTTGGENKVHASKKTPSNSKASHHHHPPPPLPPFFTNPTQTRTRGWPQINSTVYRGWVGKAKTRQPGKYKICVENLATYSHFFSTRPYYEYCSLNLCNSCLLCYEQFIWFRPHKSLNDSVICLV